MPIGLKTFKERAGRGEWDSIHFIFRNVSSAWFLYQLLENNIFHENHIEIQSHSISSFHCFDNVNFFHLFSLSLSFAPFFQFVVTFFLSTSISTRFVLFMHSSNKAHHSCVEASRNTICYKCRAKKVKPARNRTLKLKD